MKIEIDQSGRIEYTRKPTVLAFSNSKCHSIIMMSADKQYLQRIFRKAGKSKILMIKTFSALVFLLIKDHLKSINEVVIDIEYTGYNKIIKEFLLEFCNNQNVKIGKTNIRFGNIGKKSSAHLVAISAYRKKKADRKVTAGDILKLVL